MLWTSPYKIWYISNAKVLLTLVSVVLSITLVSFANWSLIAYSSSHSGSALLPRWLWQLLSRLPPVHSFFSLRVIPFWCSSHPPLGPQVMKKEFSRFKPKPWPRDCQFVRNNSRQKDEKMLFPLVMTIASDFSLRMSSVLSISPNRPMTTTQQIFQCNFYLSVISCATFEKVSVLQSRAYSQFKLHGSLRDTHSWDSEIQLYEVYSTNLRDHIQKVLSFSRDHIAWRIWLNLFGR